MPVCDGVEAAKRVRALESRRKVSVRLPSASQKWIKAAATDPLSTVVALSADCQQANKQLCLSAGMNSFLSKPLKKSGSQRDHNYISADHNPMTDELISLLSMYCSAPT